MPRQPKGNSVKKAETPGPNELRSEYTRADFGRLVRGKYVNRLTAGSNVVVLDPEVCDVFPDAVSVNAALRSLAEIARRTNRVSVRPRRSR